MACIRFITSPQISDRTSRSRKIGNDYSVFRCSAMYKKLRPKDTTAAALTYAAIHVKPPQSTILTLGGWCHGLSLLNPAGCFVT